MSSTCPWHRAAGRRRPSCRTCAPPHSGRTALPCRSLPLLRARRKRHPRSAKAMQAWSGGQPARFRTPRSGKPHRPAPRGSHALAEPNQTTLARWLLAAHHASCESCCTPSHQKAAYFRRRLLTVIIFSHNLNLLTWSVTRAAAAHRPRLRLRRRRGARSPNRSGRPAPASDIRVSAMGLRMGRGGKPTVSYVLCLLKAGTVCADERRYAFVTHNGVPASRSFESYAMPPSDVRFTQCHPLQWCARPQRSPPWGATRHRVPEAHLKRRSQLALVHQHRTERDAPAPRRAALASRLRA